MSGIHVAKLGGSLLDLPDLVERFGHWRAAEMGPKSILVVGGGTAADVVRHFDAACALGDVKSHWLAIRAMQFNAHCTAAVLPRCRLVDDVMACRAAWDAGELAIIDPLCWLEREDAIGVTIPHRWTFTSDSVAAHIATRVGGVKLTMLKSTLPTPPEVRPEAPSGALPGMKRRDGDAAEPESSPSERLRPGVWAEGVSSGGTEAGKNPGLRDRNRSDPACGVAMAAALGIVDPDFIAASAGIATIEIVNLRESPPGRCVLRGGV